jgi:hypothetical protein
MRKIKKKEEKIKLESKYLILTILAGLLYYLAYFLKFPNSYLILISIIVLIALFKNFNVISGIKALICLFIFNAITLPLVIIISQFNLIIQIIMFAVNVSLICLMIYGLKNLKKWAFYLALAVLILSCFNLISLFVLVLSQPFILTLSYVLFVVKNALSLLLLVFSFVYIIKSKKYFVK